MVNFWRMTEADASANSYEINDAYQCPSCGATIFTTLGSQHECPPPYNPPGYGWTSPNIHTGYICAKCNVWVQYGTMHQCVVVPINPELVTFPKTGWVCPVCGKGNAPIVTQCPCDPKVSPKASPIAMCELCKNTGRIYYSTTSGIGTPSASVSSLSKECPNGCQGPLLMNDVGIDKNE